MSEHIDQLLSPWRRVVTLDGAQIAHLKSRLDGL